MLATRTGSGVLALVANGLAAFAQIVRTKIFASLLGVAGVGLVGQAWAAQALVLSVSPVYSGIALVMSISQAGMNSESAKRRAIGTARSLALLVSTCGSVAVGGLAILLSGDPTGDVVVLVGLAVLGAPFGGLYLVELARLTVARSFGRLAIASAMSAPAVVVAAYLLTTVAAVHGAALALSAGWVVSWAFTYVVAEGSLRLPNVGFDLTDCRRMWRLASASLVGAVVAAAGSAGVRYVALALGGPDAAGVVHILMLISMQILFVVSASVGAFSSARVAELAARADRQEIAREIVAARRLGGHVTAGLVLVIAAFAGPLVSVISADDFQDVARILPVQLIGDLIMSYVWLTGLYLQPLAHRRVFVASVASWNTALVVLPLALTWLGPFAVPVSHVVGAIVSAALVGRHALGSLGVRPWSGCASLGLASIGVAASALSPIVPLLCLAIVAVRAWVLAARSH